MKRTITIIQPKPFNDSNFLFGFIIAKVKKCNYRMTEIGRDLWVHLINPCSRRDTQSRCQGSHPGSFWRSPRRRLHSIWAAYVSTQPPIANKCFLIFRQMCFSFCPLPLILHQMPLRRTFFILPSVFLHTDKTAVSLFPRLNSLSSLRSSSEPFQFQNVRWKA